MTETATSAEILRQVELLRASVRETLLTPVWGSKDKASRYLKSAAGAPAAVAGLGGDIYVGVAVIAEETAKKRGRKRRINEDSAAGLVGWVNDLDVIGTPDGKGGVRQTGAPSVEAAITAASLIAPPTLIIASGGGVQPWYLFEAPLLFTSREERKQIKLVGAKWQQAHRLASGFEIDSTHDLSRLARLAGTRNYKDGGEGVPVKILADDGPRHSYAKLAELVSNIDVNASSNGHRARFNGKISPERLEELVAELCAQHPGFSERWNREPDEWNGDDNRYDMSIASKAVSRGLTDDEIRALLIANRLIYNPDDEKIYRDDYFALTIGKARSERPRSNPKTYPLKTGKDGKLTLPPIPALDDVAGQCGWLTAAFRLDPKHSVKAGRRYGLRGVSGCVELQRVEAPALMFEPITRLTTPARLIETLVAETLPTDGAIPPYRAEHCREIAHVIKVLCGAAEMLTAKQETANIIATFMHGAVLAEAQVTSYGSSAQKYEAAIALRRPLNDYGRATGPPRYAIDHKTDEMLIAVSDLQDAARRHTGSGIRQGWLEGRMDALGWQLITLQGYEQPGRAGRKGPHARIKAYRGHLTDDPPVNT